MIIWVNGAFGGGKTTLAEELHRRLPDALPFDPEYVGHILIKWAPPGDSGDFQDISLWRKLVSVLHVFIDVPAGELRRRIEAQVLYSPEELADQVIKALTEIS